MLSPILPTKPPSGTIRNDQDLTPRPDTFADGIDAPITVRPDPVGLYYMIFISPKAYSP